MLGPLLFNIFINDIFFVVKQCILYNYASDNTLYYSSSDLSQTKAVVEAESENIIPLFAFNNMQATPEKFRAIVLGRKAYNGCKKSKVSDTDIKCEESVKLLGVTVNYILNFDFHISNICKRLLSKSIFLD